METTGTVPDITAHTGDSGAAIDPTTIEPAAKRADTKDTPILKPTLTDKPPDLSLPAAQAEGMTPQQVQHEQDAGLGVLQTAHQAEIDSANQRALLNYSGPPMLLSRIYSMVLTRRHPVRRIKGRLVHIRFHRLGDP